MGWRYISTLNMLLVYSTRRLIWMNDYLKAQGSSFMEARVKNSQGRTGQGSKDGTRHIAENVLRQVMFLSFLSELLRLPVWGTSILIMYKSMTGWLNNHVPVMIKHTEDHRGKLRLCRCESRCLTAQSLPPSTTLNGWWLTSPGCQPPPKGVSRWKHLKR
jgi:hypothetical protein